MNHLKDDRAFGLLHQELPPIACLSTFCCQNLEKNWGNRENFWRNRGSDFVGSDRLTNFD